MEMEGSEEMKRGWVHAMRAPLGEGLTLWGRSRAADATAFVVPELQLGLDAGAIIASMKLATILISHTHADHSFRITHLWSRQKVPDVIVPGEAVPQLEQYANACTHLSGNIGLDSSFELEPNMTVRGVAAGEAFRLRKDKTVLVEVFDMSHSVPCRGYGVSRVKSKLRAEFAGRKDIAELRKQGVDVMQDVKTRLFVFCGDTDAKVFAISPEILSFPVVVIECSFLFDDEQKKAANSRHMLWSDLRPIVETHPNTRFILIHFSMRYSRDEIIVHFEKERAKGPLSNVEIMLQDAEDLYGSTFGLPIPKSDR